MPSFTVKEAAHKKHVDGKYGPMQVIGLYLEGHGSAEWFTKADTPIPAAGTVLEGELETGEYGQKFKKAPPAGGFGGGGGSWKPRDPAETRSIVRQHSQHMALLWAQLDPTPTVRTLEDLKYIIDWFDADVEGTRPATPPPPAANGGALATPAQKQQVRDALSESGLKKIADIQAALKELQIPLVVEDGWTDRLAGSWADALVNWLRKSDLPTDFPKEPTPEELAEAQASFEAEAGK